MAEPPFDDGAVKLTDACAFPAVAMPMVGTPGTTAFTVRPAFAAATPVTLDGPEALGVPEGIA